MGECCFMEVDMIIDDIGMETPDGELEEAMGNGESLEEQESEPTSIIVTNLQPHIFEEPHQKVQILLSQSRA